MIGAEPPPGAPADRAAEAIAQGVRSGAVERKRLSEQVSAALEKLIVSGEIKAGDTLPSERDLMALFGVGRTSIREALFALQRKGIVSAQAGLRPVVSEPRAETIVAELSGTVRLFLASEVGTREFQAARRFFEPAVARFAARHATTEDLAAMGAAFETCQRHVATPQLFVDADVAFHFAIVQATHSQLLITLHRAVLDWLREQRVSSIEPRGSAAAAQRAHRRVYDAICARDPDRAEKAMIDHLNEVERFYWSARGAPASPARKRGTKPGPSSAATTRRTIK